jgi:NDP-sugar pyrophosphorylase family protein
VAVNAGSLTVSDTLTAGAAVTASQNVNLQNATAVGAITATAGNVIGGAVNAASVNAGGNVTVGSVTAGSVTATAGDVAVANNANVTGDVTAGAAVSVGGTTTVGGKVQAGTTATFTGPADIGGNVTAAGAVNFQNTTVLGGNVTGNGVTFGGAATFDGADQVVNANSGTVQANSTVTKITAGNLDLSGGAGVNVVGDLAVNAGSLIVGDNLTAGGTVTASQNVTLEHANAVGAITAVAGNVTGGSLVAPSISAGGRVAVAGVNAGSVTATAGDVVVANDATVTGNLNAGASVYVGGNTAVGGNIQAGTTAVFAGPADIGGNVGAGGTVHFENVAMLGGDVTGNGVTFNGAVTLDGADQAVDATVGTLQANSTVTKTTAGNLTLAGDTGVNTVGNVAVNAGSLTVSDILNAGAAVTASQSVNVQNATAVGAITATAGNVNGGAVNAASVNAAGSVTVGSVNAGSVTATAGDVAVANDANVTGDVTAGAAVSVGGSTTVGGKVQAGTTASFTGPADIGGNVTAVGAVNFQNSAALGGNVTGNGITLNGAVMLDGADQAIDATVGTLQANSTVTKATAGNLTLAGDAGVNVAGDVALNSGELLVADKLTLLADMAVTATKATFDSTVDGTTANSESLTLNGDARFNGKVGESVSLDALHVTGKTEQNGESVKTGGVQDYDGAVTLVKDTTLTASKATFGSTVDGTTANSESLTLNGNARFNGKVGDAVALEALHVTGKTEQNGESVKTGGAQDYDGAVTLVKDTTLTASKATFGSTVDGTTANTESLTLNGNARFNGKVGDSAALEALHVTGSTEQNGESVRTGGAQDYDGAVTLVRDTTVTASKATFGSTVDGTTANSESLTLNSDARFNGKVGEAIALEALHVTGKTEQNGESVKTGGAQNYDGAVTLVKDTTLIASKATFGSTVDGTTVNSESLTVNGDARFNGKVGEAIALEALQVTGETEQNGESVKTGGAQVYDGKVTLLKDTELTGSSLTFNGDLIGGGNDLVANGATTIGDSTADNGTGLDFLHIRGDATLNAGSVSARAITIDGRANLNGNGVTTTDEQNYLGSVALGANQTLSGSALNFRQDIVGGGKDLTANGTTAIGDAAGDTASGLGGLVINGTTTINAGLVSANQATINGAAQLNGGTVTTTAGQTYNGTVNLGVDQTFNASVATVNGNLIANHHTLGVDGETIIGGANAGHSVSDLAELTVSGGTVLNSVISGQTLLDLQGHIFINAPNAQVNPGNKVPFARTDFRTWAPGVLVFDSTAPAAFWRSTGQSQPAEDLFRRILGAALPQPKHGDPKQVEGEAALRTGLPPGYTLGSTDTNVLSALREQ